MAVAEEVFTDFAGPWAKSTGSATKVDVKKGYHAIHVEDDNGEFLDDQHSEDSWYLFCQAIEPSRYDELREKTKQWVECWALFTDHLMDVERQLTSV